MRPNRRLLRQGAAIAVAVMALSACGGGAPDDGGARTSSSSMPAVEIGSELAGVAFDVRRDPG